MLSRKALHTLSHCKAMYFFQTSTTRNMYYTCSVERGPAVVVGVVQQQHNGWSWPLRGGSTLRGDGGVCGGAGGRGAGAYSCGCGCSGGSCSAVHRFSHSGFKCFQDHFTYSILRLALLHMVDCVRSRRMIWKDGRKCPEIRSRGSNQGEFALRIFGSLKEPK